MATPQELAKSLQVESDNLKARLDDSLLTIRAIADKIETLDMPSVSVIVPYHSQWENGAGAFRTDCGPACVRMLLDYKQCAPLPTVDRISSAAGMTALSTGTTGPKLVQAGKQFGLSLEFVNR